MLDKSKVIIDDIVSRGVEEVMLFHSASGKDSIALLDLVAPRFKRVVCVFMYIIKDMGHINRYINYSRKKYPNCEFVQIPHFAKFSYIKTGYMGIEKNPKQRNYNLMDMCEILREKLGIDWAFFGFKQSDSLNRRLMLRGYLMESINDKSRKCYPLSHYKNADILEYIRVNGLIPPERYGPGQSAGQNITDIHYLMFVKKNYPEDMWRIYREFPDCERLVFEYEYKNKK